MDITLTLANIVVGCAIAYFITSVFVYLKIKKLLFEINVIKQVINNIQNKLDEVLEKRGK